ncbi:MAG: hypothetical protein KDE50_20455, partial [Caldilineaceae bacterium]|nr:hypothetical protein [Caldilineaceae bacterium]
NPEDLFNTYIYFSGLAIMQAASHAKQGCSCFQCDPLSAKPISLALPPYGILPGRKSLVRSGGDRYISVPDFGIAKFRQMLL